jgi:hypothetical protein
VAAQPTSNLEEALDALYGAAPENFVAERSRLAKGLKQNGHKEEAQTIAAVRKPTVAAWALNQLSRGSRREIDLLLDAGHRLRTAQTGVLAGAKRDDFDRARAAEQQALAQLIGHAEALLKERGSSSPTVLNQISQSLRVAAVSVEGRELLARGRFGEPLLAEGFDLVSELAGSLPRSATKPRRPTAKEQQKRRRLSDALRRAKSELGATEQEAASAKATADRLAREAETAREKAAEAEDAANLAAKHVRELETQLDGLNPGGAGASSGV